MEYDFRKLSHEELAELAQKGDLVAEEFLIREYKDFVKSKARAYFIIGAEGEDVVQEGMIGLFKAIKSYLPSKEASFKTYANLCINRQILDAIKAASRKKHSPLNTSVSLSRVVESEGESKGMTLEETLKSTKVPDFGGEVMLDDISQHIIKNERNFFSAMEIEVWKEYIDGKPYGEIAEKLNTNTKAIYNAMERLKRKILQHFED